MDDGEEQDVDAVSGKSWFGTSGTDDTDSLSAGAAQAKDVDTPEWLSRFLLTETAEPFNSAWLESVQGAESDSEADLAHMDMATSRIEDTSHRPIHELEDGEIVAARDIAGVEEVEDDALKATPIPAGPLNLKCGHVGYYGILGRRQKVPDSTAIPYRWVCQLIITRRDSNGKTTMAVGSGVLVSPKHVLTAAHWIKWAERDNRNLWVSYETTSIRVVPGRYDEDTPFGSAFAKLNMKVAPRWDPKAPNLQEDYALIELDTALGDATPSALRGKKLCYWGSRDCPGAVVRAVSNSDLDQLQGSGGITAGYANDRFDMRQYMSRGGITHVNPGAIMHMAAHPWEGGSPVWINVRGENQLVGLMLASNVVLRITQPLCDQLRAWMGSQVCSTTPARTAPTEIDLFDPAQREAMEEYLFGESGNSEQGQEQLAIEASDDGEIVTIGPEGSEDYEAAREGSNGSTVRGRILWPALGFPAVIAPGSSSDAETTKCITLLVLSNQRTLTSDAVARHLRCVPWAERGRKHIAEDFFSASDVTILSPKISFTANNESQAQLVEFGGTGATAIRASLATVVRQRYAKELPFLHEIRISESRSAKLTDGLYHLFWNNASTADDAPSDEMAFLLANYGREKRASLGPLWQTHERYLMDEFEYEYGSLHRPYCSTTAPRVRAEILHPLFVDRSGRPTLKVGHLTDLHVDVRNDVYEENVKAREYQLKAKAAKQALSSDEQAQLNTLALFNNWNTSVVALYNDAKLDANAILLTGDLIDYGRAHWGQDAGPHLQDNDLYTVDRNWFLFSYLLSSGAAYTKPVYTILYPPFAIGAPSSNNFFYKERPWKGTVEAEKELREWEGQRANEALRAAHGDGHARKFSYAAKAENELELLLENTGDAVKALLRMMIQRQTMNVEDTPAETTVKSVEWYLLSINPFLDYAFTLPNQHRVHARLGGKGERPLPNPLPRQELSVPGVAGRCRGRSRSEGEELPDVTPAGFGERLPQAVWAVEDRRRARAADRPVSGLDRQGHARRPDEIRQGEGGEGQRSHRLRHQESRRDHGAMVWASALRHATEERHRGRDRGLWVLREQAGLVHRKRGRREIQCPGHPVRAHSSQWRVRRPPCRERNGSNAGRRTARLSRESVRCVERGVPGGVANAAGETRAALCEPTIRWPTWMRRRIRATRASIWRRTARLSSCSFASLASRWASASPRQVSPSCS